MTLLLSKSGIELKTGWTDNIYLTTKKYDSLIPFKEFLAGVFYVLTNSSLLEDDPRLDFIKIVGALEIKENTRGEKFLIFKEESKSWSLRYPGFSQPNELLDLPKIKGE